jgi:gamma-glutamyltranspeptidase/glutathione hydrolase
MATNLERFALSPDTQKLLEAMGHKLRQCAAGQPHGGHAGRRASLGGKPVGRNRFYGANDPRRNTGLAAGY